MTRARRELVDPDTTSYYHCICRCVRRAFLCGKDSFSGKSYEHRKGWVVERLRLRQKVFAVELCAYAVMSNHYHLVVRLNRAQAKEWSDEEVITRWKRLYSVPLLVSRYRDGEAKTKAEKDAAREAIGPVAFTPRRSLLVHAKKGSGLSSCLGKRKDLTPFYAKGNLAIKGNPIEFRITEDHPMPYWLNNPNISQRPSLSNRPVANPNATSYTISLPDYGVGRDYDQGTGLYIAP